jgi:hypothetical protein
VHIPSDNGIAATIVPAPLPMVPKQGAFFTLIAGQKLKNWI